jgi:hypothetical protein
MNMGRAVLDSVAVYRVKVIDRATGAERFVNAEASSPEEAIEQVAAFGEMVGGAELVEVKRSTDSPPTAPMSPPKPTIVHVPVPRKGIGVGGVTLAIILALLLFPVVAIVLFAGGAVGLGVLGAAAASQRATRQVQSAPATPAASGGPTLRTLVHTPAAYFDKTVSLSPVEFHGLSRNYVPRFEKSYGLASGSALGVTLSDGSGEFLLTTFAVADSAVGRELLSAQPGTKYRVSGQVFRFENGDRAGLALQELQRVP